MTFRVKCSRCGEEMGKLSGLPACPKCGPSNRWGEQYDAPVDYAPGGYRRAPTPDSDGPEDWPVEDENYFDNPDQEIQDED